MRAKRAENYDLKMKLQQKNSDFYVIFYWPPPPAAAGGEPPSGRPGPPRPPFEPALHAPFIVQYHFGIIPIITKFCSSCFWSFNEASMYKPGTISILYETGQKPTIF